MQSLLQNDIASVHLMEHKASSVCARNRIYLVTWVQPVLYYPVSVRTVTRLKRGFGGQEDPGKNITTRTLKLQQPAELVANEHSTQQARHVLPENKRIR